MSKKLGLLSYTIAITLLSGCATIKELPEEAGWSTYFDTRTTAEWKQEGFSLTEAKDWVVYFNPNLNGIRYDNAFYHTTNDLTMAKAARWKGALFTPTEAHEWTIMGFQDPTETAPWLDKGFSRQQVQKYRTYGFRDPEGVREWQALELTDADMEEWGAAFEAKEVKEWAQMGFNKMETSACKANQYSVDDVNVLIQSGRNPEDIKRICGAMAKQARVDWETNKFTLEQISRWSQDFSLEEAIKWRKVGFTPSEAHKYKLFGPQAALKIKQNCPGGIKSIDTLYSANPYDVAGKCYEFVGETQQILSKSTALFNQSGRSFYIDFGKTSAPAIYFRGVVRGVGAYTYTTTMGAVKKVPHLMGVYQSE